ncbi:MAG TPA: hypothetical protein VGY58_06035 [Gemmataceae bacterium]|jgi:hypothetical protein|nr:hypothetical protein [Gemmataceae bacterium]
MTKKSTRPAYAARPFLAAFLSAVVAGCGVNSSPVAVADEDVLLTLDCYDPMYQLDAHGRVIKLKVTGLHLPVAIWAAVGRLAELRYLDAAHSTLTDEGLAQLNNLQELRSFGLGGTLVTDQGLVHLEKLPSLQAVWLSKGTVTVQGVEKLKKARPDMNVHFQ